MTRVVGLFTLVCILGQAAGDLTGASAAPRTGAAAPQVDTQPPYLVTAAYPFWRASTLPAEAIPFEYLDQIGHHSVMPGAHGTLQVPAKLVMPELIELAHRAGRRVNLSVGGAHSHDAFAAMVADPGDRAAFVLNLTEFVMEQGYDGVTIDWEFPQSAVDRRDLSALMGELRSAFDATSRDLQLSIAVSSNESRGQWVDVEAITPQVHYYVVMTFGYYGPWSSVSGHNAPLYPPPSEAGQSRSVDRSLGYWIEERGVPPSKILMGVASFGIWFDSEGLNQPFTDTRKADYRYIKALIDRGYTRHWDGAAQVPYLTQDDGPGLWSYDDPRSVGAKCDYLLANGLGGAAVWDVSMDRVAGEHELLNVIAHKLSLDRVYLPLVRTR
jgi:chitinase